MRPPSPGLDETAREYSRQALQIAQEIGDRRGEGAMWMKLGLALAGLGRLDEAASAYGKSVALRRELGRLNQAMEPLAGLARVALTREDLANVASHREIVGEWAAVAKRGSVGRIANSPYTAV